jgi:hypothetical protein
MPATATPPAPAPAPARPSIPQSFASARPPKAGDIPPRREPAEYNLSEHPPGGGGGEQPVPSPTAGNAELTAALRKTAGEPKEKVVAEQVDEPPATPAAKPATKPFVAADDPLAESIAAAEAAKPAEEVILKAPPKAAQLREAYEELKVNFSKAAAEGDVTRKELAEFRKKAQLYEDQIKSLEPLKPRIEEYEKRIAQYDERLKLIDYTQHPEFHEKFVKPVSEALQNAHAIVKEMVVESSDGTQRLGNEQDFAAVLAAPNLSEATRVAKELFGPDLAQTAIAHRTQVLTAERRRQEAVKDAGLKSQEFAKTVNERQHAEAVKFRESFQRASDELADKYAPIYKVDVADKEASDTYQRGLEIVNAAMERDPSTTNDEFIQTLARVRHRAASFPVMLLKNQRLQTEVETLKSKLAAYEKSSPETNGRGESNGNSEVAANEDPRAELRRRLTAVANRKP